VFERPATAFVARFMGDHNVISGRVAEARDDRITVEVAGGGRFAAIGRPRAAGEAADFAVRTDRVRLGEPPAPGLGFTGSITSVEYRGASVKLTVSGAGVEDFTAIFGDDAIRAQPATVGKAVSLAWNAEDAIVLGRLDS